MAWTTEDSIQVIRGYLAGLIIVGVFLTIVAIVAVFEGVG